MRVKIIKKIIITFIALSITFPTVLANANEINSPRAQNIFKEIRCLVCQNQSIEDSNAGLAKQLRSIIKGLISEGYSDKEIKKYLVARYGDWILLNPPFNFSTAALWILPFLVLFIAIIGGFRFILKRNSSETKPLNKEEKEKIAYILKRKE